MSYNDLSVSKKKKKLEQAELTGEFMPDQTRQMELCVSKVVHPGTARVIMLWSLV